MKYFYLGLALILSGIKGFSQINLAVQVTPPYTHKWQDYLGSNGKLLITATSTLQQATPIYLAGSIRRISGGSTVSITIPPPPMGGQADPNIALMVYPGMPTMFNTGQVANFFDRRGNGQLEGIDERSLINGIIPEGMYQLCLQAFGLDGMPLSNAAQGCVTFPIYLANPPRITQPMCGGQVTQLTPQNIIFSWTMPQGSQTAGTLWQYRIQMALVPAGMEANNALNNASVFSLNEQVNTNSYIYTSANLPLLPGNTYAWRVQAYDPLGNTGVQNQGYSEVCTFIYSGDSRLTALPEWPLNNDWIPFRQIPLIAKFTPYSDLYTTFGSSTTVLYNGARLSESRTLSWPLGPRLTQQNFVGGLTNEQASQIVVFPEAQPGLGVASPLIRGKRVNWECNISLGVQNNGSVNYRQCSLGANFNIGMPPSVLQLPANRARVAPGLVRFEWLSATPPSRIRPDYLPVQARAGSMNFYNANVEEKWMLEVSRNNTMLAIVYSDRGSVGQGLNLMTPEAELRSGLYKNIGSNNSFQDTGMYYWRVKWLNDPGSATDTSAYQYSPVFSFRIAPDSSSRREEAVPPVRSACVAACDVDPALLANREEITNVAVSSVVKMGKFDMRVTEIRWTGNIATGKGVISVPFMRTGLIVSFSGLKVNRNNQALAGTATADYDPQSPIASSEQARSFTQLTGMSEGQLNGLHGLYTQTSRLVSQLTSTNPVKLPIGLDNEYQGTKYVIGIVGVYFTYQRATLNVLFKVDFPEADGWLSLGATDICFHPNGMAGTGRGMLYNPLDKTIHMGETDLIFKRTVFNSSDYNSISDSGTYVQWDCDGFKVMQIKGEIHFGRDVVVPDNADGTVGAGIVKGYFNTRVRNLKQFILDFRMDRFQSPGAPGWGFEIQNASLDLSDRDNPAGFRLPVNYQDAPPTLNLWKGFYLKSFAVYMPPVFHPSGSQPRTSFSAQNMFIDRTGLSAEFNIRNRIVSESECTVDGWAFGIDSLKLRILQLGSARGEFAGNMWGKFKLPVSPTSLGYTCNISTSARRVAFGIQAGSIDTLNVPLWFAGMQLTQTLIGFNYSENQVTNPSGLTSWESSFGLSANLSGNLHINGRPRSQSFNPGEVRIPQLEFQNLRLSSNAPYFECTDPGTRGCVYFAHNSPERSVGGFPVTLNNVGVVARTPGSDGSGIHPMEWDRSAGPRVGLRIGFSIITGGNRAANSGSSSTNSNGFNCTSSISFVGRLNTAGGAQWVPTGLLVDSILVSGTTAAVTMSGSAVFFTADAVYGDGFKGEFRANIKPGIDIRVAAQFGNKQQIRYWYADGMMSLPVGIPIGPSGLRLYGFGGGVYSNMRLEGVSASSQISGSANTVNRSSTRYVPVDNNTIGIKATVAVGAVKKEMLYGEGTLEIAISPTQGLQSLGISGNCRFMSTPGNTQSTAVWGDFAFTFLVPTNTFDGNVNVFVNAAAGTVKGQGENNRAGSLVLHFGPDTWHIKLGEPANRIGLKFSIPRIEGAGFNADAYLMAGRQLPGIPDPPALVRSIVIPPSGGWGSNREALADGFCFGASASFNSGSQTVANFVRYRLEAALGFDVAIRDLSMISCMAGNGSYQPGVNGWYANGQAYAAVSGGLALKIPLPLTEEFVSVADFSAALLLNAGLPNPWWLKGELAGSLNLLGFIRIDRFTVPFEVGEKCSPVVESPMASQPLISDLKPGANEHDVDPFIYPEVGLNFAHDQQFSLEILTAEGNKRIETYKVFLQELKTVDASNGVRLAGASLVLPVISSHQTTYGISLGKALSTSYTQGGVIEILNYGYSARLKTDKELKPNTQIRLVATAFALKWVAASGWEVSKRKNNTPIYQDSAHTFRTGDIPLRMQDQYVRFTYPYRGQRYMLQSECETGRVEIWNASMMNAYFSNDPRQGYTTQYLARFVALDGSGTQDQPITKYTSGAVPYVQFRIPALVNSKTYALILVRKLTAPNSGRTGTLTLSNSSITGQYINSGAITRRLLGPLAMGNGETAVYTLFFKTSQHNTLQAKLNANTISSIAKTAFGSMECLNMQLGGTEGFDEFDAYTYVSNGINQGESASFPPLINMGVDFTDGWYTRFATPYIYQLARDIENMGGGRTTFVRSDPVIPGIPPTRSVTFSDYEGYIYGKLNAAECRPVNPSLPNLNMVDFNDAAIFRFSTALTSQINRAFVSGSGNRNAVLVYSTPTTVAFDWSTMKTKCMALTRIYGEPERSEFIPIAMRPKIRKVLNNEFEVLYRGTYRIQFYYAVPGQSCRNTDTQSYNFKSFIY